MHYNVHPADWVTHQSVFENNSSEMSTKTDPWILLRMQWKIVSMEIYKLEITNYTMPTKKNCVSKILNSSALIGYTSGYTLTLELLNCIIPVASCITLSWDQVNHIQMKQTPIMTSEIHMATCGYPILMCAMYNILYSWQAEGDNHYRAEDLL